MTEMAQRKVLFSDLDIVGHVNNVKYMEWCIDAWMSNKSIDLEIRNMEINFMHEAMLGDSIIMRGSKSANEFYFVANRAEDDKEIVRARLTLS